MDHDNDFSRVIEREMSEELKSYFSSAETLRHSGKKKSIFNFYSFLFL